MARNLVRRGSWVLTVGGGGLAAWALTSIKSSHERRIGVLSVGLSGVMVGAVGLAHDSLAKVTRDVEEAYKLGGDIQGGIEYERGYRAGRRIKKPVIVDLTGGDTDGDNEEMHVALDVPEVTIRLPRLDDDAASGE